MGGFVWGEGGGLRVWGVLLGCLGVLFVIWVVGSGV